MQNNMENHHHITPLKTYLGVAVGLFILTVVTVAVSFLDFGPFNLVVALLIAAIKGSLVALFFMHLLYDNKLFGAIFSISIAFVAIFIILTMFDTMGRDMVVEGKSKPINEKAVIYSKQDSSAAADTTQSNH
ncbi:MAG: cytochrome-c oxidase [Caldithrix sp.]|nr:cytochrome-c oxidase [Caldithrix sp.]